MLPLYKNDKFTVPSNLLVTTYPSINLCSAIILYETINKDKLDKSKFILYEDIS